MFKLVQENYEDALKLIDDNNPELAKKVIEREDKVDKIEESIRISHIQRLSQDKCSVDSSIVYIDLISNLERVSDHCSNIAKRSMRID